MSTPAMFDMSEPVRIEVGARSERTEWGIRYLEDTFLGRRGDVDVRPGESAARWVMTDEAARLECGWPSRVEVVSRTVVTYTSDWSSVVAEPGGSDRG